MDAITDVSVTCDEPTGIDLDAVLDAQFPVLRARTSGDLAPAANFGVRYVVAADGLWREVKTPWLYALLPIATRPDIRVPSGALVPVVTFACGNPPLHLWRDFMATAQAAMPNEAAGAMLWNAATGAWRFAERTALVATPGYIEFAEVTLQEHEHLVVDIHSHASFDAHFSDQDDNDDCGSIKLAAVVGNIGAQNTLVCRLNAIDQRLAIDLDAQGNFKVNF